MTVKKALLNFFFLYLALILSLTAITMFFQFDVGSSMNIWILGACVFWACSSFAKKNGRYFEGSEKTKVVVGFIAINLLVQLLPSLAILAGSDTAKALSVILVGLIVVGLLHLMAIYVVFVVCERILIKSGTIRG